MSPPEQSASLSVDSSLDSMQVSLVDSSFNEVVSGAGGLRADGLRPGIYELRFSAGTVAESRLISLSPGEVHQEIAELAFPTATPLPGSSTRDLSHELIAERASQHIARVAQDYELTGAPPVGGGLLVMSRVADGKVSFTEPPELEVQRITAPPDSYPSVSEKWLDDTGPTWVVKAGAVDAGGYCLRTRDGTTVEQPIWVAPGWQTLVFLPSSCDGVEVGQATIVMFPADRTWEPGYELETAQANELALAGLRERRSILPDDLTQVLLESKFVDPMLGLLGAHSLLLRPEVNFEQFDIVIRNLERLLPGLPDVTGLKVLGAEARAAAGEPGEEINEPLEPIAWPPMLLPAYAALIRYDALTGGGTIVPGSPAETVAGLLRGDSIWTAWSPAPDWQRRRRRLFSSSRRRGLFRGFGRPDLGEALREIELAEPATRQVMDYLASVADVEEPTTFSEMLQTELGSPENIAAAITVPLMAVNRALKSIEEEWIHDNE